MNIHIRRVQSGRIIAIRYPCHHERPLHELADVLAKLPDDAATRDFKGAPLETVKTEPDGWWEARRVR